MDIERLEKLKTNLMFEKAVSDEATRFDKDSETNRAVHQRCNDLISLIDAEIARQSVTSEEVQEAIGLLSGKSYGTHNLSCDCVFCKAIDIAITALQAYQPWISVSERLPEKPEYDWVLVHITLSPDGFVGLPHVAELRRGEWFSTEYDLPIEQILQGTVTHWKPLPEPPKGE